MKEFFLHPSNNLKTLVIPNEQTQVVTVQIWFRAGSSHENKDQWGLAHFLEHMFFKGTKKRPDGQIMKEVESFGGEVNAFTSFDYTCYYINAPYTHWQDALDILLDMVSNPIFRPQDVKSEKMVVYEEYMRANDNPGQFGFYHLQKNCFKGSYAHPILGHKKDIMNFSVQKIKQFRKENYNVGRCLLILGGNILQDCSVEKLEKMISAFTLPKGPQAVYSPFSLKQLHSCNIHFGPTPLANVNIVFQSQGILHGHSPKEELLFNAITNGESAPIVQKIVYQSSLAQHFSTSSMYLVNGCVHFISFSCPVDSLSKIYTILIEYIRELLKAGLDQEQIDSTYQQYLTSKIYDKENITSYANPFGHYYALTQDAHYEEKFLELSKDISREESIEIFKRIFSANKHAELQLPRELDVDKKSKNSVYQQDLENFLKELQSLTPVTDENNSKASKINKDKKNEKELLHHSYDPKVQVINHSLGQVLLRTNSITPTFNLMYMMPGGLSYENGPIPNGSYNILSHLLSKGHKNIAYLEWKKYLEKNGISFHGFSGKNAYGMSIHGQSKDFKALLGHLFDSLLKPNWDSSMFEHEKEMMKRAIIKNQQDPVKLCFQEFSHLLFKNHSYALPIIGTLESLDQINEEQLKNILSTSMQSKEGFLSITGDVSKEHLIHELNAISQKYTSFEFGTDTMPIMAKNIFVRDHHREEVKQYIPLEREQTHLLVGYQSYSLGTLESLYIRVFCSFLNGPDSPLFYYIRDKLGLCYTIRANMQVGIEGGSFGIYMATGVERATQALSQIHLQLENYAKTGLTKKQLQQTITLLEGEQMLLLNTNDDFLNAYSLSHYFGLGFENVYKNLEKIKKMKLSDLNEFLKHFLKSKKIQVVVGPKNLF